MKTFIKFELITNYLKSNKISKNEFCKRAGIGLSVLNKMLADKHNFRSDAIVKVANTIGVKTICNY